MAAPAYLSPSKADRDRGRLPGGLCSPPKTLICQHRPRTVQDIQLIGPEVHFGTNCALYSLKVKLCWHKCFRVPVSAPLSLGGCQPLAGDIWRHRPHG